MVHGAAIAVGVVDADSGGISECDERFGVARSGNLELQIGFGRTGHAEVEIDGPRD